MASKSKKRAKRRTTGDLFLQLRRNLERGDYKQALKDARVCYRETPDNEHRQFLECAYIGRAQQLCRQGLRDESREVVKNLLELGVTQPSVESALPELLATLGMLDRLTAKNKTPAGELPTELLAKAADQAVLHPDDAAKSMPELRTGALKIRAALTALTAGDDAGAATPLQDIPRGSPFSDWKLLIRGLAAYYRQDTAEMLANWQRLDPGRLAARIAEPLKVLSGAAPRIKGDQRLDAAIGTIERGLDGCSLVGRLAGLQRYLNDSDWPGLFKAARVLYADLKRSEPALADRLKRWLCSHLIHEGMDDEMERFVTAFDPPPLDPRWNRARALVMDGGPDEYDEDTIANWQNYANDLARVEPLSPAERKLAQAMVWRHIAVQTANRAQDFRFCNCGASHDHEVSLYEDDAREAFEKCFAFAPTYSAAYRSLAAYFQEADEPNKAAEVYLRSLAALPDDLEAVLYLARHYQREDDTRRALEFAQRARALKPLDKELLALVWAAHVGAARDFAREQKFDLARAEFAAADALIPENAANFDVLARKAALETKAGDAAQARKWLEAAQQKLEHLAPLWLQMTIESIRYELPSTEIGLYEKRLSESLRQKCNASAVGWMCKQLTAHLRKGIPYRKIDNHVDQVTTYVRRCSRVKWDGASLRDVCDFLYETKEVKLLAKYAKKGHKQFPQIAFFPWALGELEYHRGPARCNRKQASTYYQRVLDLAKDSVDAGAQNLVEKAKRRLTTIEESQSHRFAPPTFDEDDDFDFAEGNGDPLAGIPQGELLEAFAEMCKDLGLDPQQILEDAAADGRMPFPLPSPKKQKQGRA